MKQFEEDFPAGQKIQGKYTIISQISKGSFGRIYKVEQIQNNQLYAVKITQKSELNKHIKLQQLYQNEVQILKLINHENVCSYIDDFQDLKYMYLILEYCDQGDLAHYISSRPTSKISEDQAIKILKQIALAFKEMHRFEQKIIHRDIKLENILLKNDIIKLADFGFSRTLQQGDLAQTGCGSLYTMAPEILRGQTYGVKVDVYSLGVVLYTMLCGMFPYYGNSEKELQQLIMRQDLKFQDRKQQKVVISEKTINLIRNMIQFYEQDRISFEELNVYLDSFFDNEQNKKENLKINQFETEVQGGSGLKKEEEFYTYKIKVLGDYNVGKTTFIEKLTQLDKQHKESLQSVSQIRNTTMGIQYKNMKVNYKQKNFNLQIWDTAGQERYHSIVKSYYRKTDIFLLIYDISDIFSLRNVELWISRIREYCDQKDAMILIIENKQDLIDENFKDNKEISQIKSDLSKDKKMIQVGVSSKKGTNIEKSLELVLEFLITIKKRTEESNNCQLCITPNTAISACSC